MLNDVYFCHQGLIRLLRHSSAAIACGADFFIDPPEGIVLYDSWVMRDAVSLRAVQACPLSLLCFAFALLVLYRLYLHSLIIVFVGAGFQDLQGMVSFGIQAGRKIVQNLPPYVQHPHSAARFEAGLPIPVTCCWNGIVSIDAAPLAKGVRFR